MTYVRKSVAIVGGLVVVSAVISGCSGGASGSGSGSGSSSSSTSSTSKTPSTVAAPNAAATETNPPGDIPDNQAYVAFQPSTGFTGFTGFTVKVPEGWARTVKGTTTVFTDKLNRVQISAVSASAAPASGSVTNTVVPQLRTQVPKFASPKVTTVQRKTGSAVLLTYQGDSAPDPVTGKVVRDAFERYAFYKQGHEVDLTLSGPVNADNVDPWRIVTDSFAWR
ncbi:hypothetical protein AB0N07_28390 [Streptomyces sp. NPDC051172]|uniref:hypothetical protein n=1 Tax=Streptomyces sp. NPDC051172 TaxID=3155796 RepID=UPI003419D6D1